MNAYILNINLCVTVFKLHYILNSMYLAVHTYVLIDHLKVNETEQHFHVRNYIHIHTYLCTLLTMT